MSQPRAYTHDEARDKILEHIRRIAEYWATLPPDNPSNKVFNAPPLTIRDRCDGVAFSILSMLDGVSAAMPGMILKLDPHPEDADFLRSEGARWFEPGMEIEGSLHDRFYKSERGDE